MSDLTSRGHPNGTVVPSSRYNDFDDYTFVDARQPMEEWLAEQQIINKKHAEAARVKSGALKAVIHQQEGQAIAQGIMVASRSENEIEEPIYDDEEYSFDNIKSAFKLDKNKTTVISRNQIFTSGKWKDVKRLQEKGPSNINYLSHTSSFDRRNRNERQMFADAARMT